MACHQALAHGTRYIFASQGFCHIFCEASQSWTIVQTPGIPPSSWLRRRDAWAHGSDCTGTHALAAVAESHGVQWLCYESFRALGHRCAAVFDPDSLSEPTPSLDQTVQTWRCKATRASVMFSSGRESFVWDL